MSWWKDPELFLSYVTGEARLYRLKKNSGSPFGFREFTYEGTVTNQNYLSLVDKTLPWNRSDFQALGDFLFRNDIRVNCQGLAVTITFPRDKTFKPNPVEGFYFWSHDVVNLTNYGLPLRPAPFRSVQYMGAQGCAPVESSPKEDKLAQELAASIIARDREKSEKQALEKSISSLKAANSALKDEVQREKNDKIALINSLDKERIEKQALEESNNVLEAKNATLSDEMKKEKDDNASLTNDRFRHMGEKQALEKRLCELQATNSTLKDDVQKEKDDKATLMNDLDREKAAQLITDTKDREQSDGHLLKKVEELSAKQAELEKVQVGMAKVHAELNELKISSEQKVKGLEQKLVHLNASVQEKVNISCQHFARQFPAQHNLPPIIIKVVAEEEESTEGEDSGEEYEEEDEEKNEETETTIELW